MNGKRGLVFIGPLLVLLLWAGVSYSGTVDPLFLATPGETVRALVYYLFVEPVLLRDSIATLTRVMWSFAIGALLGIIFGLWLGVAEKLYMAMEMVIDFFRSIPKIALFPLFLLIFGIGDAAKIAVAAFAAFWIILLNTIYGVKHGSKTRRRVLALYRATRIQTVREVVLWDALPQIFIGLRVSLSLVLIFIVATEMMVGATGGLGYRLLETYLTYKIPGLYAILLITGLMGYFLNKTFVLLERKIIHWVGHP